MKKLLLITFHLFIMTMTTNAQNGVATTERKTFSRSTKVSIEINADPSVVWALLTNATDFPRWNSTVISLEGEIKEGKKIQLVSTLAPDRTFKIKVKEMQPDKMMIWGDSQGNRHFTIEKTGQGKVLFTMYEKMGSFMFPLYANKIPSFDKNFEQYAADLKKEAEAIANTK